MKKHCIDDDNIFLIRKFLSHEECDRLIERCEALGFEEATISTAAGFVMNKSVRDNDRVILDDPHLANQLWLRAKPFLPPTYCHRAAIGFNERFRFYRYAATQQFAIHSDGFYRRENGEQSNLTFMIYLNDDFKGGETNFFNDQVDLRASVTPERGTALVFVHYQLHEGAAIETGCKYVLRTDVMFSARPDEEDDV